MRRTFEYAATTKDAAQRSIRTFYEAVNIDRLIDGAAGAAETCYRDMGCISPDLAILISCVARKLVLRQRVEEEVEGVRNVLGKDIVTAGFYSYGEISPITSGGKCEIHNQTMTITTFSEI